MADTTDTTPTLPSRPEYMLTTVDNPYNPWIEWDAWFAWDQSAGYNTPGLLARVARVSDDLSEADQHVAIQEAIDEIVRENTLGVLKKVKQGEATVQ